MNFLEIHKTYFLKYGSIFNLLGLIIWKPSDKKVRAENVSNSCVKKLVSYIKSFCVYVLKLSVMLEFWEFKEFVI